MLSAAGSQGTIKAEEVTDQQRLKELDAYWAEVSRCVASGDFEGYANTCHPEGVLVSGKKKTSYLLTEALKGWKEGIEKTRTGEIKAGVVFRFSQRWGNETTAHETGIFHYHSIDEEGKRTDAYVHLVALLLKTDKGWKVLMENQQSPATKAEWDSLKEAGTIGK
ncbi:MAG: hypothetical protein AAF514_01705 [Verrucomicrobiota bacterium]